MTLNVRFFTLFLLVVAYVLALKPNSSSDENIFRRSPLFSAERFSRLQNEEYEYEDFKNQPITPINDGDTRYKDERYLLRLLKTTTKSSKNTPIERYVPIVTDTTKARLAHNNNMAKKKGSLVSFYRRGIATEDYLDWPQKETHCHDVLKLIMTGARKPEDLGVVMTVKSRSVRRLIQLLTLNTTGYSPEDIYSVLYQLNNIKIRLFQWDFGSMYWLIGVLVYPEKKRTFRKLKRGVKRLFVKWHLDLSNITNLALQAKIFRPICVPNAYSTGSTRKSTITKYATKKATTKKLEECSDE